MIFKCRIVDGCQLAREIHSFDKYKELPLILLSSSLPSKGMGNSTDEFAVRLMKPIKQADLFNALTTALGKIKTVTKSLRQNKVFDSTMAARLPLNILIAEDNFVNQKVAMAVLLQFGYRTDLVVNGKEAVEAAERQKYDLLLYGHPNAEYGWFRSDPPYLLTHEPFRTAIYCRHDRQCDE